MSDDALEAVARDAIARHMARRGAAPNAVPAVARVLHQSFALCVIATDVDTDGSCLIEPSVQCTHCGYCRSYGH